MALYFSFRGCGKAEAEEKAALFVEMLLEVDAAPCCAVIDMYDRAMPPDKEWIVVIRIKGMESDVSLLPMYHLANSLYGCDFAAIYFTVN